MFFITGQFYSFSSIVIEMIGIALHCVEDEIIKTIY